MRGCEVQRARACGASDSCLRVHARTSLARLRSGPRTSHTDVTIRLQVTDTGSTSTVVRRLEVGLASSAARRASRIARRSRPFRKNCARYSSLMRASAAGAGPRTSTCRRACADARHQVARRRPCACSSVRVSNDDVDERQRRRIAHARAGTPVSRARNIVVVLRGRRLHAVVVRDRASGRWPRPDVSPRPARPTTCVSSWNVRSPARKSAMPEPDVGRHHAHQRDRRKVVPLGDHLRADEDVDLAARDGAR